MNNLRNSQKWQYKNNFFKANTTVVVYLYISAINHFLHELARIELTQKTHKHILR